KDVHSVFEAARDTMVIFWRYKDIAVEGIDLVGPLLHICVLMVLIRNHWVHHGRQQWQVVICKIDEFILNVSALLGDVAHKLCGHCRIAFGTKRTIDNTDFHTLSLLLAAAVHGATL